MHKIALLLVLVGLMACEGSTMLPTPMPEDSPSFASFTSQGVQVTYPGTSFVVGGGAGETLTCNYWVKVRNSTGGVLWGYAKVVSRDGGLTDRQVTGEEEIRPGGNNIRVSVTGPSSGFTSVVTFVWVTNTGRTYVFSGDTYCTYI